VGWENAHLHRFEINSIEYGTGPGSCHRDPLEHIVAPRLDIRRSQVRRPWNDVPTVLFYGCDFGDGWGHELRVEKMSKPNPRLSYPRCLAGARAGPPEDCGGPLGYRALREEIDADRGGLAYAPTALATKREEQSRSSTLADSTWRRSTRSWA